MKRLVLPLLLAAVLAGCSSKPSSPPVTAASPDPVSTAGTREPSTTDVGADDTKVFTEDGRGTVRDSTPPVGGYLKDIFFELDKAELSPEQRDVVGVNADWIRKNPTVRVLVEGHCDERGTAQYNLALGERRASAVKEFLVSLGIDGGRVQIVSYGKERPFNPGHDDAAWAQNRRGHFVILSR